MLRQFNKIILGLNLMVSRTEIHVPDVAGGTPSGFDSWGTGIPALVGDVVQ